MEFRRQCWKRVSVGRAVPAPSWKVKHLVNGAFYMCRGGEQEKSQSYLDNLIAFAHLINVLLSVQQETAEIDTALPGLEAAFVDVCPDVGGLEIGQGGIVVGRVFGHQLDSDVEELAAGEQYLFSCGRGDLHGAVGYPIWEGRELVHTIRHMFLVTSFMNFLDVPDISRKTLFYTFVFFSES